MRAVVPRSIATTTFTLCLALVAVGCQDADAPTPPGPSSPEDTALYDWLVEQEVPVTTAMIVDVTALPTADPADRRHTVGVAATLDATVELSGVRSSELSSAALPIGGGAIRAADTGFVWSGVIEAPTASAVRLELTDLSLPPGAELYVYSDAREVDGPYTGAGPHGSGHVWTHTLLGQRIGLQLHYRGPDVGGALAATRFTVSDVGVLDDRFILARFGRKDANKAFCSFNESCVHNASCSNIPSAVADARDAVALMLYASGAYLYICTGGLIADTAGSQTPYFLTANHCVSKGREASSLETFFGFTASCGDNSCNFPSSSSADTTGAAILATSKTGDFTLLELSGNPPAGSVFLPFDNTPIAYDDNAPLYRVSHPGGAPQAYSEHRVDTSAGTCGSWPRGNWIYSRDTYGATEGGSSGSPVLNAAGEVVGQLSGGCGTNVYDVCDNENNATVDGAFAAYWSQVAPYLDVGGGCTDADGDGVCGSNGDCDDSDPAVHPGANENCSDGVDNDCDGDTDSSDSDCGGGACFPVGAACTADSDCCSNKCKGPQGGKTCK